MATVVTATWLEREDDSPVDVRALGDLSLDAFLALPEIKPALEYAEGDVTQKVAPQGEHSALQSGLATIFNQAVQEKRVARAFSELRVTHGGRSYVPDIAVYRWERVPRRPDGRIANRFTEPPDIAVEIVSPEQRVTGLVAKCIWYVEHGAGAALLLDPDDSTVIRFRPGATPQVLRGTDVIDLTVVVPGIVLTVTDVFALLRHE